MRFSPLRHLPSVFSKTAPIQLTFFVTRRCNAACPFCFYLRPAAAPSGPRRELELGEVDRIARSLGNLLWLAFSGGEIFLREDLADIARAFYRHTRPVIMLFPTNGMLPELIRERIGEVLRDCPRSTIAVKLSLDGVGDAHDAVRNTPGSFERTLRTYRLLEELLDEHPHFELGVNTVVSSANQDALDDIIDLVRTLPGIGTHTLSLARGSLAREQYKDVDLEKYERAAARIERDLKAGAAATYRFFGGRVKAAQDILQRRLILRTARERRRLIPCYAGTLNLVLDENGDVSPCEIRQESFGNVREHGYDMRAVLRSERAAAIRGSIGRGECFCTHECYQMTNILFNPRLAPSLGREFLQLRR